MERNDRFQVLSRGCLREDLKTGIPICNLARVTARGDLDLAKSEGELAKLGKSKAETTGASWELRVGLQTHFEMCSKLGFFF